MPDPVIGSNKFVPSWGAWDNELLELPGGSLLQFDYSQLRLSDYRQMRDHPQVNISLSLLSFMVAQVPWRIVGGSEEHRKHVHENLEHVWPRFVRSISPAYWAGYSPVAVEYDQDDPDGIIRIKKFKDIPPEMATVHWKEVAGYGSRSSGSPTPKIKVFDGIDVYGQNRHIPVTNSFWYSVLAEAGSMKGKKLLRPSFAAWYFSQITQLYYNRYLERFGEPTIIGRAPFSDGFPNPVAGGPEIPAKEVMETIISGIRSQSGVVLPNDMMEDSEGRLTNYQYVLEYMEGMMRGADFDRALGRLDETISLGVFSPALLYRTSDVGSYNLGETHMSVFLWMTNSLVDDLADYINNFLIHKICDFNGWPKRHPTEGLMRFEAKNLGQETQALYRQLFQALIQNKLAEPDLDDLSQVVGMKVHRIPEEYREDPKQEAASSGTDNNSLS